MGSITHYRRTYNSFRSGKAQGAKGETDQFHVEPTMPPVDEKLLDSETFVSMTGSMSKVTHTLSFHIFLLVIQVLQQLIAFRLLRLTYSILPEKGTMDAIVSFYSYKRCVSCNPRPRPRGGPLLSHGTHG